MGLSQSERKEIWQQRLDRYLVSGQTVAEFCKTEGVSVPSFYHWKRRLITSHLEAPASKQNLCDGRTKPGSQSNSTPFAELVVTNQADAQGTAQAQLPNGICISLGGDKEITVAIVDRLLTYEPTTAIGGARSASRSSC